MPITAAITEEEAIGTSQRLFLDTLTWTLEKNEALHKGHLQALMHFQEILERAERYERKYERETREMLVRILGEEDGPRFLKAMLSFTQDYLKRCQRAGRMLPLNFRPAERRPEIIEQLKRVRKNLYPSFPLYSPARRNTHLCCGG